MHILIADSDIEHRNKLIKFMEQEQNKVTEVMTFGEIATVCKSKCPDLLLIDSNLPGSNGAEIVNQIRQLGGLATWNPIILMSPTSNKDDVRVGLNAGADDYLTKPIDLLTLEYKINSAKRLQDLKDDVFSIAHNLVVSSHAAMEVKTSLDNMTGTLDNQAFRQRLEVEWYNARKKKNHLSLILVNLDNLREYNDIYGSENGDECIKKVSHALAKSAPKQNKILARVLGDNFGVLLPNTNHKQALELANTFLKIVDELKIPHKGSHNSDHVTASIGVASTENDKQKQPTELLDAADFALYQAKHKGRNKVYAEIDPVKS